jgi:hypothetical protein
LFDMLNVRYIVVALDDIADPTVVAAIASGRVEVFRNDEVAVYENQAAFPRAWIVHEVRQDDGTALAQLQTGDVDGRTVAFVDDTIPPVAAQAGDESVTVTFDTEERRTAIVEASAPGLVVFSEIWDEGWHATVDGEPVETIRANRALVGVPVGAGAHTIELRYEPPGLRAGMLLSSLTGLAVIAAAGMSIMGSRGRNERSEPDSGAVQPEGV